MKIACDHGGYELAKALTESLNLEYLGPESYDAADDYPVYAQKLCNNLGDDIGILICKSGQGMCIAANRFTHVRAVLVRTVNDAMITRKHNHANVICLSADHDLKTAIELITTFKNTAYDESERHCRRVKQL